MGIYYLKILLNWNKNDTLKALAKYNAGTNWKMGIDYAKAIQKIKF